MYRKDGGGGGGILNYFEKEKQYYPGVPFVTPEAQMYFSLH